MTRKIVDLYSYLFIVATSLVMLSGCLHQGLTCSIQVSQSENGANLINDGSIITNKDVFPFWVYVTVHNDGKVALPVYGGSNAMISGRVSEYDIILKEFNDGVFFDGSGSLSLPPIYVEPGGTFTSVIAIEVEVSPYAGKLTSNGMIGSSSCDFRFEVQNIR